MPCLTEQEVTDAAKDHVRISSIADIKQSRSFGGVFIFQAVLAVISADVTVRTVWQISLAAVEECLAKRTVCL